MAWSNIVDFFLATKVIGNSDFKEALGPIMRKRTPPLLHQPHPLSSLRPKNQNPLHMFNSSRLQKWGLLQKATKCTFIRTHNGGLYSERRRRMQLCGDELVAAAASTHPLSLGNRENMLGFTDNNAHSLLSLSHTQNTLIESERICAYEYVRVLGDFE